MPIIGKVGQGAARVRCLNISIHVLLLVGAVTMLYPFLIMVSSSFKSSVDSKTFDIFPRYFHDDEMLFRKYVEARYEESSVLLSAAYRDRFISFDFVTVPDDPREGAVGDWVEFLKQTADSHTIFDYYVAEQYGFKIYPRNHRAFRDMMKAQTNGDLEEFNRKYGTASTAWDQVALVKEVGISGRKFAGNYDGILATYRDFKLGLPLRHRVYVGLDGDFYTQVLKPAYRGRLEELNNALNTSFPTWRHVTLSRRMPAGRIGKHWAEYVKQSLNLQFIRVRKEGEQSYRDSLKEKYETISLLNKTYGTDYRSFEEIELLTDIPTSGARMVDWGHFIENVVSPEYLEIKSLEFRYRDWLKNKYGTVDAINRAHGKGLVSFEEAPLASQMPLAELAYGDDWLWFVRSIALPESIELLPVCRQQYQEYVETIFPDGKGELDLAALNEAYGTSFDETMNVYPARTIPASGVYREHWLRFVKEHATGQFLAVNTGAEASRWQDFLKTKYASVNGLNRAWGLLYEDFDSVPVEHWATDYCFFLQNKSEIFREFVRRNYLMVLDVMLYNGRAILNTVIYCSLSIMLALLVNPLAAYAMSRYKLPTTYKIILVLMLTMAFPPMVMGIPTFLLIKKLNLLNTFFALVLPAAADGYFIFLLKGFFDSLPQELFESATIDGAGEHQIFWNIAMALSKPIMAVIALNAFNIAYRNFMMAFILCQDSSMWTMMVHIYQLIQTSSASVGYAALVIAAVPTLLVFIFCQNIIIRGIVVPTEK